MIADRLDALLRALPTDPTWMAPAPSVTAERKKRKKRKNKKKGQQNIFSRCQTQVASCGDFLRVSCGDDPLCDAAIACCKSLATCDASEFLFCLLAGG